MKTFKLSNGIDIPALGLGVWRRPEANVAPLEKYVPQANLAGINYFSTFTKEKSSKKYARIKKGLKALNLDRKDLFLAARLWNDKPMEVIELTERIIKELDIGYLDLLLLKGPKSDSNSIHPGMLKHTWTNMERLYMTGKCKALGVNNYQRTQIEMITQFCTISPHLNHFDIKKPIRLNTLKSRNVQLSVGFPLTHIGLIYNDPIIAEIASRLKRTTDQVMFSWVIQSGIVVIPDICEVKDFRNSLQVFELNDLDFQLINDVYG